MPNNKHIGSSFEDFLKEEGIDKDCKIVALESIVEYLAKKVKDQKLAIANAVDVIEYGAHCIEGSAYSLTMKDVAHDLRNNIIDKSWSEILDENELLKRKINMIESQGIRLR